MKRKKMIWLGLAVLLLVPAVLDAIRYLKPGAEKKQPIQQQNSFPVSTAVEIILVYNAWGGIYPGLVDFVHKEFFPKTYPCNLCYLTFGTFSMKEEWKQFIDSLPYKKTELHKENFQREYEPGNLQLPVILVNDGKQVQILLSAVELNQYTSLEELIVATKSKLK
ncbi:MAG: hypothetical protein ABR503_11265 [Chitinophagaceae bacterium]